MLEIRGLSISYGTVEVVHGVSLLVEERQIVALIGPNGAGKSSVLRAVSGLIRPTSGAIVYLGASLIGVPPHEIAAAGIAHVMEGRHLFGGLSVEDNLLLAGSQEEIRSLSSVETVYQRWPPLAHRRDQLAGTLSGGEQQMLAIGRALMRRPRLLMLDEPSWGLAPLVVRDLMKVLTKLRDEGMTVLLVEQMAKLALRVCDYAYVMTTGRVVLQGRSEELLANPELQASYLGGKVSQVPELRKPLIWVTPVKPQKESKGRPGQRQDLPRTEKAGVEPAEPKDLATPSSVEHPSPALTETRFQPSEAFAERERVRQLRQKAFGSSESFEDLRKEMSTLRHEISTFVKSGLPREPDDHTGAGGKEWRAREVARREREAKDKQGVPAPAQIEGGQVRPHGDTRSRESIRRERQAAFENQATGYVETRESSFATRERDRRERQEHIEISGGPGAAAAWVGPGPSVQQDWRQLEHIRRQREQSFRSHEGRGPAGEQSLPEPVDYTAREKARQERQTARRRAEKPESRA